MTGVSEQNTRFEIAQKWAFGMAPPNSETQTRRIIATAKLVTVIDNAPIDESVPEHISEVKGLFARVWRQDQWDWFTVSAQLGYPSARISRVITSALAGLRRDIGQGLNVLSSSDGLLLRRLPLRRCLGVFLGTQQIRDEPGAGWIYYLSTRGIPDVAKIGMTTRSVEERVREINGATGVMDPFGVRACWRVNDPPRAERTIHAEFESERIRADREFFRVRFRDAQTRIDRILMSKSLEIRTLNALTALAG